VNKYRLPRGGRIDRTRAIRFSFDGQMFAAHPGDTLASALLANGQHLMGRSLKYHRPRGAIAAGAEEPNALVTIGTGARRTPNLRATQVEPYDGLQAFSQNRWPSLRADLGAVVGLAAPMLGAGFYYKTFMQPAGAWHRLYEPTIRRAAGLGRAPREPDPDLYTHRYAFCDVLVVGAGAAGLAAARAAAERGATVVLADEQMEAGGGLLQEAEACIDGARAAAWRDATCAAIAAHPQVRLLLRTTAFGYFLQNYVGLVERLTDHVAEKPDRMARERLWKLRARQVVLATGAIERPLVFAGNDRPGIMLAGAARAYINRWAVRLGTRAVLATADDSAYALVPELEAAGIEIAAIADLRASAGCATDRLPVRFGTEVVGTSGGLRVSGADLAPRGGGPRARIACDLLLMSGGWTPSLHLFAQSRGAIVYDAERGAFLAGTPSQDLICAGACRGLAGLQACADDGAAAGALAAARALGRPEPAQTTVSVTPAHGADAPPPGGRPRFAFVDFQNDVTQGDIVQAVREGFRSIEHVKRYTTTGMATDQGKTSSMNALAIAASTLGRPLPRVGLTTFRMPYTPVTFGALAGHQRGALFEPVRRTPMHARAEALGAVFEPVGQWLRAHHFPRAGETEEQAVARECRAVRGEAGMFDASTLGKIEVAGPDAATFLDRMYAHDLARLAPGRCRYAIMLNEAGFVMDDGVVGRLAEDRFHVTTTTSGIAAVRAQMEDFLQTEFTDLRAWLTDVTEQWAVVAVQGPRAREIVAPLVEGVDLSAFPHMSVAEPRICGVPGRLFRVSFTGELGYELNVPASEGEALWDAVYRSGAVPYGTEAMHVLRAEKGYIVIGHETDGTVTPDDLGLGSAIGRRKVDFIGARSLLLADLVAPGRMQLVGLLPEDGVSLPEEGSQLLLASGDRTAAGYVTSAYRSATLGRPFALALLAGGRARIATRVFFTVAAGPALPARVVPPVFYDPAGARLHG